MIIFSETKRVHTVNLHKITLRNISKGDCPGDPVAKTLHLIHGPQDPIPDQETRSHMMQLRVCLPQLKDLTCHS